MKKFAVIGLHLCLVIIFALAAFLYLGQFGGGKLPFSNDYSYKTGRYIFDLVLL